MSSVLFYSNFCTNCKNLLLKISKSNIKDDIHFISIDKRINKNNSIYIILENNQEFLLPPTINAVPALLLINDNYKVLFGESINSYLKPINQEKINVSTNFNGEPNAYSIGNNYNGVVSDNYSFLDQNSDDLSTKGDGGMRQLYNYATINHNDKIETPPDDYIPDKVNEDNLKNYENNRNNLN